MRFFILLYVLIFLNCNLAISQSLDHSSILSSSYGDSLRKSGKIKNLHLIGDSVLYVLGESSYLPGNFWQLVGVDSNVKVEHSKGTGIHGDLGLNQIINDTLYNMFPLYSNTRPLSFTMFTLDKVSKIFYPVNRRLNYNITQDLGLYFKNETLYKISAEGKIFKYWYNLEDSLFIDRTMKNNECNIVDNAFDCESKIYGIIDLAKGARFVYQFGKVILDNTGTLYLDKSSDTDTIIRFKKLPTKLKSMNHNQIVPCNNSFLIISYAKNNIILNPTGNIVATIPHKKGFPLIFKDSVVIISYSKKLSCLGFSIIQNSWLQKFKIRYGFGANGVAFLLSKEDKIYEVNYK